MAGIFISYRQADAKGWAIGLRDDLAEAFGEEQVFLDKDALGPGNWHDQLQRALEQCSVVLVVIGKQWLTIADEHDRPRIHLPDDVHRQEIALALRHAGMTVIPVLVDDATMPKAEQLPEDIRGLADQQAFEIGDTTIRRKADLEALVNGIKAAGGLVVQESSGDSQAPPASGKRSWWPKPDPLLLLGAVLLTLTLGYFEYQAGGEYDGREIAVILSLSYCVLLSGKCLWRLITNRRRRVI